MYLDYFSLNRHPFRITPDPSLFFPGGPDGRGVILNALIYGITSGEGILKVVGEVGSGKTMLCRMLEEQLPDNIEIVYIANPSLSAREILYAIAIELKLEVTASTERLKVLHMIQDYLLDRHGKGGSVVVFVEEAQGMPLETLEEIRLLSNLETHQHKLLQMVLFGQPELDKILAQKNIRQLRERITHSFRLEPLSAQATSEYIRYRLKVAGCPRSRLFSNRAEKMIAKASSGLTRRINILADKALLASYADSPGRHPEQDGDAPLVLPRHVRAAIADTDYRKKIASPWILGGLVTTAVGVAGVVVALHGGLSGQGSIMPVAGPARVENPIMQTETAVSNPPIRDAEVAVQTGVISRESLPDQDAAPPAAEQFTANTQDTVSEETPATAEEVEIPPETETVEQAESVALAAEEAEEPVEVDSVTTGNTSIGNPVSGDAVASGSMPESQQPAIDDQDARDVAIVAELADEVEEPDTAVVEDTPSPPPLLKSPVTMVPSGLAELRMAPTARWLADIKNKKGYTIVMFSVPSTNPNGLEEYLQFLQLISLLDDTYICFKPISSPTSGRWQVMHREFQGVTPARRLLANMPEYIRQYNPFLSNLSSIKCSFPVEVGN